MFDGLKRYFLAPARTREVADQPPLTDLYQMMWRRLVFDTSQMGEFTEPRVREAMLKYPRHQFVPPCNRFDVANFDRPFPIGCDQTISRPRVVKLMMEKLGPQPGEHALDVGTGSGWQAAVLSDLVGKEGTVTTIEPHIELLEDAQERFANLGIENVRFVLGNALDPDNLDGEYNLVASAAGSDSVPQLWIDHLAVGGRLTHPILNTSTIRCLHRVSPDELNESAIFGYNFVRLIENE